MWENAIDVGAKSWFCQNWQTFYLKKACFCSLVAFTHKTDRCNSYLAISTIESPGAHIEINLAVIFTSQNWHVFSDLTCYIDFSTQILRQLPGLFNCIIDISNSPSKTKENKLSGSLTCMQGALNSKRFHRELPEVHCCSVFWKFENSNTLMPSRKRNKGQY